MDQASSQRDDSHLNGADPLGSTVRAVAERATAERDAYAQGQERPLASYALLLSTYATSVATLSYWVRRRGHPLPERPSLSDLALVAVATHKVSRMISKDSVLAVVRAPFTRFRKPIGAGEVYEEVRGTGTRHAVGELVSCPFCLGQWVATGFTFGLLLAPRATRQVASVFCAVTASDALQFAYAALERTEH